ncbi:LacI family transcriptional regulator [Arthrobacter sp. SW1]|uniref:LacI family DNA-binding transcriptional regulator n=1 Tax=Arthrobacter sp. SW1 TaxID=1920889 RepID=UPI000877E5A2|nr:LacI family DNA-binding transcriptional regulator [Arthrobacter sp. SW1]OFI38418.1 LacI family transcriptional regulator [Arthrobacter sp. SW1]
MAKTSERAQRGGHSGISIEDVAVAAGVSTATVSRALRGLPRVSESTRTKILIAAKDLGYVPSSSAAGLATGKTRTIGVLAPYVDRWFFGKVIDGVERELHSHGYNLSLFNLGGRGGAPRERLFSRAMVQKQIDALVLLATFLNPGEIEELQDIEMPVVSVGGAVPGLSTIGVDDREVSRTAARHLRDLGHRRIAMLHGIGEVQQQFTVPDFRATDFENALREMGIEPEPRWTFRAEFTVEGGVTAARAFAAQSGPKPTAIMCASDEMALGVLFEAQRLGIRVPEELSVVGIDGHEMGAAVGLTTVWQDPAAQGQRATQMLLAALGGDDSAVHSEYAEHRLIARETTAPPAV